LTSTSASLARISIYTNMRSALASTAKGGISTYRNFKKAPQGSLEAPLEQLIKDGEITYFARKMAFNHSLDKQDHLGETKKESRRLLMAPRDRFINKKTKANTTKENACASRMKI
jgi:hypothetical protein